MYPYATLRIIAPVDLKNRCQSSDHSRGVPTRDLRVTLSETYLRM